MSHHSDTFLLEPGFQFSAALDPHRRAAYTRALDQAFKGLGDYGGKPSVALIGWQAATLIGDVAGRAGRVVIVEQDPELVATIQEGIVARGLGKNVTLLEADPLTVDLDERVDIAVAGLSTTWFMEGPAARILANAREKVLKKNGLMIPRRFVHLFELASSPTEVNGISLRVPRYNRPGEPVPVLSESKHFMTTDLTDGAELRTEVEDTIIVKPLLSGTLTGLRLTTLSELGPNNIHPASHSGFQAIFVPLREDIEVEAGKPVKLFLRYNMGEGLTKSRFLARPIAEEEPTGAEPDAEAVASFRAKIGQMVEQLDATGRGADLDKVVSYTFDPHGDVSRLTALFWTVDEEFRKPLKKVVESFRREASQHGPTPSDDVVYELMLDIYRAKRGLES